MKKIYIFILGICVIATSACSIPAKTVELTPTSYNVVGDELAKEVWETSSDASKELVVSYSEDEYGHGMYYNFLSEEGKVVYDQMYVIFRDMLEGIEVDTISSDVVERAGAAVMYDHPELFYLTNYSYSVFAAGGITKYITVDGIYSSDKDSVKAKQKAIDSYFEDATREITQFDSDYDKIKCVYDYIISHTEYNPNSIDNQNIASVCIGGASVCTGYAKTFQYIMHKLGIECELITGYAMPTSERHAWNIVKADGNYYNIDATWGEGDYIESTENVASEFLDPVNYDYFLVPDEWIKESHIREFSYDYPVCDSIKLNYYVVNGLFLESLDKQKLHNIFDDAYINNYSNVKFKTASDDVFADVYEYLIEDKNIGSFVTVNGPIYYVPDTSTDTFIVLLK